MADDLGRKAEAAVNLGLFHPVTLQNFAGCCKLTVPNVLLILASLIKAFPADAGLSAVGKTDLVRQVALASDDDPVRRYFPSADRDDRF